MSGKKRGETLPLAVIRPCFDILDELGSGLDVELYIASRRSEAATRDDDLSVLAITHFSPLLRKLHPDMVHVFADGWFQESCGPELAEELEQTSYHRWIRPVESLVSIGGLGQSATAADDQFADQFVDPFA